MIKNLIKEYGISWLFYRVLYSLKIELLKRIPLVESVFERTVKIQRVDIFKVDVNSIEEFYGKLADGDKDKIISDANLALKGKIKAFSSVLLDYGDPIKWDFNPLTGVQVDKKKKWYTIPDFDSQRGDLKTIWEISRFTHFLLFARAYILTHDIKYYSAFSDQLKAWLDENEYSYGANYKCSQEAVLRMINTLITFSVFNAYGLISEGDYENVCTLTECSYKKTLSNFFYAHKCIKNNHTLTEITGLIVGAWCSKNTNKLEKAYRLMDKEIQNQFLPDGGYIQFSFNYQRVALQIMEFIIKICETTKMELSDKSLELIERSALMLYQVQMENGDVPNYGSNDGALFFPLTVCGYRDFRPIVNTIYALVKNKKIFNSGPWDEELLWFASKEAIDYENIVIEKKSSEYIDAGIFSFRQSDKFLMTILQNYKTRPAQMDQLHIDLWHSNDNIFCDCGTFSYASELGEGLSLTASHNTGKVSNKEQMKKKRPFLVYAWSKRKDITFDATHFRGTMISQNGYEHMRDIEMTDSGFKIIDKLSGEIDSCKIAFHTPYGVKLTVNGFELYDGTKELCVVNTNSENIVVSKGYRSLYYLSKEEINRIGIMCKKEENRFELVTDILLKN